MSLLLAELGHRVVASDWSPEMIARARAKLTAAAPAAQLFAMDAAAPALAPAVSTSCCAAICCGPCPTRRGRCGGGRDCCPRLAMVALAVGLIALRRGERSWLAILGFALALLFGGFWILFGLAELLFPH